MNINDMSEEEQIEDVSQNGMLIADIENPSVAVQLAAIRETNGGFVLKYIRNPAKEAVILAILLSIENSYNSEVSLLLDKYKNKGWSELDIIRQSIKADRQLDESKITSNQIAYILEDPDILDTMDVIPKDLQLALCSQRGSIIQFLPDPDEDVQVAAVINDPLALPMIHNPYPSAQYHAFKKNAFTILRMNQSSIDKRTLNHTKHDIITFILRRIGTKNHDVEIHIFNLVNMLTNMNLGWPELVAIKQSLDADKLSESDDNPVRNPYEGMDDDRLILAIKNTNWGGDIIPMRYIKNPSEKVQLAAINQELYNIEYIKHPTDAAVELAFKINFPEAIQALEKHPYMPIIHTMLEQYKESIIKFILGQMAGKTSYMDSQSEYEQSIVDMLWKQKIDWPELKVISLSISSDLQHDRNRND